jgi:hypothetical protein
MDDPRASDPSAAPDGRSAEDLARERRRQRILNSSQDRLRLIHAAPSSEPPAAPKMPPAAAAAPPRAASPPAAPPGPRAAAAPIHGPSPAVPTFSSAGGDVDGEWGSSSPGDRPLQFFPDIATVPAAAAPRRSARAVAELLLLVAAVAWPAGSAPWLAAVVGTLVLLHFAFAAAGESRLVRLALRLAAVWAAARWRPVLFALLCHGDL